MTRLEIPDTAYAFAGQNREYIKASALPLIAGKLLRDLGDEFRDYGHRAENNAALSTDYAAGYAQACFDADARLNKWAEEIEDEAFEKRQERG